MTKMTRILAVVMLAFGLMVGAVGSASAQNDASGTVSGGDASVGNTNQSNTNQQNGTIGSSQGQSQNGGDQATNGDSDGNQTNATGNSNDQSNTIGVDGIGGDIVTDNDDVDNDGEMDNNDSSDNNEGIQGDENTVVGRLLERLVELLSSLLDDGEEGAPVPV